MSFDLVSALRNSPDPARLTAAAALMASGRYVEAVYLLEEAVAKLETRGVDPRLITPFLQLSAEGLRNAAARFAITNPYFSRVDQRVRIGWLEQTADIYRRLEDAPNHVATLRALASAHLSLGEALTAMYKLKEAADMALPVFMWGVDELKHVLSQLADACQRAYEQVPKNRLAFHYNMAVEGAAYRFVSGDPVQAMSTLDALHAQLLQAAQVAHKVGAHDRALRLLAEGVYWGLVTGQSDVLNQHADLFVNYAALAGHGSAIAIYDRAIALRQAGSHDLAQRLVLEEAIAVLDKMSPALSVRLFHDVVDVGAQQQIAVADHMLKDLQSSDPKILTIADAKRAAALLQLTGWAQTLNALVPTFLESQDHLVAQTFIDVGFTTSLQQANAAFSKADLQMRAYYDAMGGGPMPPVGVALLRAVSAMQWSDPASVQKNCALLASHFGCTVAEVEVALMPRGLGTPAELRIRKSLGDFNWERLRRIAIARELLDQHRIWQERGISFRGRR